MATKVMPIPVEEDIECSVTAAVASTQLCKLDVIRQALRFGVPMMTRLLARPYRRCHAWQDYIDDYPPATHTAAGYKTALKQKLKAKHGRDR